MAMEAILFFIWLSVIPAVLVLMVIGAFMACHLLSPSHRTSPGKMKAAICILTAAGEMILFRQLTLLLTGHSFIVPAFILGRISSLLCPLLFVETCRDYYHPRGARIEPSTEHAPACSLHAQSVNESRDFSTAVSFESTNISNKQDILVNGLNSDKPSYLVVTDHLDVNYLNMHETIISNPSFGTNISKEPSDGRCMHVSALNYNHFTVCSSEKFTDDVSVKQDASPLGTAEQCEKVPSPAKKYKTASIKPSLLYCTERLSRQSGSKQVVRGSVKLFFVLKAYLWTVVILSLLLTIVQPNVHVCFLCPVYNRDLGESMSDLILKTKYEQVKLNHHSASVFWRQNTVREFSSNDTWPMAYSMPQVNDDITGTELGTYQDSKLLRASATRETAPLLFTDDHSLRGNSETNQSLRSHGRKDSDPVEMDKRSIRNWPNEQEPTTLVPYACVLNVPGDILLYVLYVLPLTVYCLLVTYCIPAGAFVTSGANEKVTTPLLESLSGPVATLPSTDIDQSGHHHLQTSGYNSFIEITSDDFTIRSQEENHTKPERLITASPRPHQPDAQPCQSYIIAHQCEAKPRESHTICILSCTPLEMSTECLVCRQVAPYVVNTAVVLVIQAIVCPLLWAAGGWFYCRQVWAPTGDLELLPVYSALCFVFTSARACTPHSTSFTHCRSLMKGFYHLFHQFCALLERYVY